MENQQKSYKKIIVSVVLVLLALAIAVFGYVYYKENIDISYEKDFLDRAYQMGEIGGELNKGNYDDAIKMAKDYQSTKPDEVYGYLAEASAYLSQGSRQFKENSFADKAIEVLNKAEKIDPNNSEVQRLFGYAYEIKEDYVESEVRYNKAVELDPQSSVAVSGRGHMYYLYGNEEFAYRDFQKALELNPYNAKALLDLSLYHIRNETENIDILEILDIGIKHTEEYEILADLHATRGVVYFNSEDYENSEAAFNEALKYQPNTVPALFGLSYLNLQYLSEASSEAEALTYIEKVNDNLTVLEFLNKNLTHIYIIKAIYYSYVEDMDLVRENLNQALVVVDKDITLSPIQKTGVQLQIEFMLSSLN